MKYTYVPKGVCSRLMEAEIENNIIKSFKITGGCPGNAFGLSKLLIGKNIDEVIKLLKGTPCGTKTTSCPDQVAAFLEQIKNKKI